MKLFKYCVLSIFIIFYYNTQAQVKILFDNTKAETASNADWIIDADNWNLGYNPDPYIGGNEANAQRYPTPSQSNVTSNTNESYWTGALSAWGIECVKAGFYVETLPYNGQITYGNANNPQDLSNYKIFVVCEPNIMFTNSEKTAIINFVHNGGGLFIVSDHDNSDRNGDGDDSPHIWNDLFSNNSVQSDPFGITFDYENISDNTTNLTPNSSDPIIHGSYGNVTRVEFYNGTSISINPNDNPTVKGSVYRKNVSNTGYYSIMAAYAEYGSGRVVAIGDSSPFDDGSGDDNDNLYDGWLGDANGNHRVMIMNATMWLSQAGTAVKEFDNANKQVFVRYNGEQVILFVPNFNKNQQLAIYNALGQQIKELKITNQYTYLPKLISGLYFYQLTEQNEVIEIGKIIVK